VDSDQRLVVSSGNPQIIIVTRVTDFCFTTEHSGHMQSAVTPIIQSYRDLIVWKKSMSLVLDVYRSTNAFPKTETYGLSTNLRRAAVSIPSNIAEGQARLSTAEFKQSLGHARGSLMEVETYVLLAQELGYIERDQSEALLGHTAEVGKILNGLLNSLGRVTGH
jgi:four helix bundle protein